MSEVGPLTGFTVAVTSTRRRLELGAALEQRGARVVYAPAMRIVSPAEDGALLAATKHFLDGSAHLVIVTTEVGVRAWVEAAAGWGLHDELIGQLGEGPLLAVGERTRAAIRVAGVELDQVEEVETPSEALDRLLRGDLHERPITIQIHGAGSVDLVATLRAAGADLNEVITFAWLPPDDPAPLDSLVDAVTERQVDALAFTNAPAAVGLLDAAQRAGQAEALRDALRGDVLAACIGPIAAGPLRMAGIPVSLPTRPRMASLVREIGDRLPERQSRVARAGGHRIEVRPRAVVVDAVAVNPGPEGMVLLRRLAEDPGRFVESDELAEALWSIRPDAGSAEVDDVVTRLHSVLGDSRIVQGVPGKGYRLAHDPDHVAGCADDGLG